MKNGVEVSYLEIAGAAGIAIAYNSLKGGSLPDYTYDVLCATGTLLFSKGLYQTGKSLRAFFVKEEPGSQSATPTMKIK